MQIVSPDYIQVDSDSTWNKKIVLRIFAIVLYAPT